MAVGSPREYTLAGFSKDIDWRPLRFVEPIKECRICKACGIVRRHSAVFPCGHVLCENCYHQCTDSATCVCPLDGQRWAEDEVLWSTFPSDELLNKMVKCWNEDYGCQAVMPARVVSTHFQHNCQRHTTRCPKCSAVVFRNSVCAHLSSGCRLPTVTVSPGAEVSSVQTETDVATCVRRALREEADTVMSYLGRLISSSNMQRDRLDELTHGMNILKESVGEQHSQNLRIFRETVREIHRTMNGIKDTMSRYSPHGTRSEEEAFIQELVDEIRQCREGLLQHRRDLTAAIEEIQERLSSRSSVVNSVPNSERRSNAASTLSRSSSVSSASHVDDSQTTPGTPPTVHETSNDIE